MRWSSESVEIDNIAADASALIDWAGTKSSIINLQNLS